ncbi:glycosyltransferase [Nonomuraea ferruginea]
MWGAEFLPQTKIIPQCDLVITHGGNNTTTEALHFGKPMILLPLFWDQYDNAQRVHELGYGVRLSTYTFTDEELTGALDRLLGDEEMRAKLAAVRRGDPPPRRPAQGRRPDRGARPQLGGRGQRGK